VPKRASTCVRQVYIAAGCDGQVIEDVTGASYGISANHTSRSQIIMDQCRLLIRIVQQPESAAMDFEAEHSTETADELRTISGR
jgi:hypothetical protein